MSDKTSNFMSIADGLSPLSSSLRHSSNFCGHAKPYRCLTSLAKTESNHLFQPSGQLNEVELENQTLKVTLEDLQQRHKQVVEKVEQQSKAESALQEAFSDSKSRLSDITNQLQSVQQNLRAKEQDLDAKSEQVSALSDDHRRLDKRLKDAEVSIDPSKAFQSMYQDLKILISEGTFPAVIRGKLS